MRAVIEPAREAEFWAGVSYATAFFMGTADAHHALIKLTDALENCGVPYAIAGAMVSRSG